MNTALYIARRLRFKGADRKRSAGPVIAVAGIAVAFVVMSLSISVMQGFKHEIKAKIMGFDSQVTVYPQASPVTGDTEASLNCDKALTEVIEETLPGHQITRNVTAPVIFKTREAFQGMIMRGTTAGSRQARFVEDNLAEGRMATGENEVVVPQTLASALSLAVDEKVDLYYIGDEGVKARRMVVTGVYNTNFSDYDKVYVFAPAKFVRSLTGMPDDECGSVSIDGFDSDEAIDEGERALGAAIVAEAAQGKLPMLQVRSVHSTGASYFSWLSLLDTNVSVILTLMAIVSSFTLISSMFILILERVNMIGILRALGAPSRMIRSIFIYMAERLVLRGLIIGNITAGVLTAVQSKWHLVPLNPESYYLSYVPVMPDALSWILLNVAVVVIAAAVLILPSQLVATIKPSTAIRFE